MVMQNHRFRLILFLLHQTRKPNTSVEIIITHILEGKEMGYCLRVFTKTDEDILVSQLEKALSVAKIQAEIRVKEGNKYLWQEIELCHLGGLPICKVMRQPVIADSNGDRIIAEFLNQIENCKPQSAVEWLKRYLLEVKLIYIFEPLEGAMKYNGLDVIDEIQREIWSTLGGILQADHEGFTNDQGYHILWQFEEDAEGLWLMSVRNIFGKWISFEMDLKNQEHREAFFAGKVPKGVKRL